MVQVEVPWSHESYNFIFIFFSIRSRFLIKSSDLLLDAQEALYAGLLERFPKSVDLLDRSFKTITYASRVRLRPKKRFLIERFLTERFQTERFLTKCFLTERFLTECECFLLERFLHKTFPATKICLPPNVSSYKTFPATKRLILFNVQYIFKLFVYLYKRFI